MICGPFILSSANALNLDLSNVLSFGKLFKSSFYSSFKTVQMAVELINIPSSTS